MSSHTFKWQVGPRIVTDGLLFCYDMYNTTNSFKGAPTTNQLTNVNDFNTGWDLGAVTAVQQFDVPEDKVVETSATSGHFLFQDSSVTSGTTYTMSFYAKAAERPFVQLTPSTGFAIADYANFDLENGIITGSASGISKATMTLVENGYNQGWYRCTYTETANATTSGRMIIALITSASDTRLQSYTGTTGSGIFLKDVQFEASSFATPFVDGTRSTTEVLADISGNNRTVNANPDLTYNSDNTFTFDGVNDRILVTDFGYPTAWTDPWSVEAWVYIPTGADWHNTTIGSNSGTAIIGRGSYSGSHGLLRSDTQQIRFLLRTDISLYFASATGLSFDTWYHCVGTWGGSGSTTLYINGVATGTSTPNWTSATSIDGTGTWQIGGNIAFGGNNGSYGEGDIPILRLYNKALSAAEVQQNYVAQRGRFQ